MRLNDLQSGFSDYLMNENDAPESDAETGFSQIFRPGKISVRDRLGIYKNNLNVSLQHVLTQRHKMLETLVGTEFLTSMAAIYVKKNPPSHGNLNEYGFDFPSFIDNFPPASGLPYLGDMARLECAWWRSYYSRDVTPLKAESLSNIPDKDYARLKLNLHPSVQLIRSAWPVYSIHQMCLNEIGDEADQVSQNITPNAAADPDPAKETSAGETTKNRQSSTSGGGETFNIHKGGEFVMTCRPYLKTECLELNEAELKFLVYLRKDLTIGEAYGKVLAKFSNFNLSKLLKREIQRGTFKDFEITFE